jgi:predicted dehydrogenase
MSELRVGVIGVGWPGQRHIEGYQKHPKATIIGLSDVNREAVESVQAQYGVDTATIYTDYHEMLANPEIAAVSIATPNFLHSPMAIDALKAGKHVLLEKPLSNSLAAGQALADEVAAHPGQTFMIAFNNRYRPDSQLLKSKIEAGDLGEIYYAKTGWLRGAAEFGLRGWFVKHELSGGGPLIDLGVHMLDLSLWFMGNPRPVSVSGSVYHKFSEFMGTSIGAEVDVEDLATAFVKLDNGATVVLDVSWVSQIAQNNQVYAQLFGTEGGATWERTLAPSEATDHKLTINKAVGTGPFRTTEVTNHTFDTMAARVGPRSQHESFRAEVADFVDSVLEGREPGATIRHALDILRVLDAIYRSAETGREVLLSTDE